MIYNIENPYQMEQYTFLAIIKYYNKIYNTKHRNINFNIFLILCLNLPYLLLLIIPV